MSRTRSRRRSALATLAAGAACVTAAAAAPAAVVLAPRVLPAQQAPRAQSGRVAGTVTARDGQPLGDAQVVVVGTTIGAVTRADGGYLLANVPAGTHRLRVTRLGYRSATVDNVVVEGGQEARGDAALDVVPASLGAVVVSASRRAERITDAPATITRIGPELLETTVGNNAFGALKEVKGLDFIQVGVNSVAINARGFNSSFNNRMLMMEDGRVSVLPENGLPVGQFTATPKVDLAGMEVLVGPGSALYGADASSGVISLQTRDPRQFPGTTVEVTGGNRSYRDVQARHAGVAGNFGYKLSGEYLDAEDWSNFLSYTTAVGTRSVSVREDTMPIPVDFRSRVARGSGALVYYAGANRAEISAGASQSDGVGQTNVGRNQLKDWGYNFAQAKYSTPHWYLNAYRAQSTSGESFALNRFANNFGTAVLTARPLSADSLRLLSDWPSDGRMYAAEVQGNYQLPALLNTAVVFGTQFRQDQVSSDRQWLSDRRTGKDVSIRQVGVYGQATMPAETWLDVVLAARLDDHERYARQFSPKAGLIFKPGEDQAVRVTYNRAFKSPTILQTDFFIPDWTAAVSIYGNTGGFTVRDAAGTVRSSYAPLEPEENRTWEVGYKGVLRNRLFVDVAGYYSKYENFMSPLAIIANPFDANPANRRTAFDSAGAQIKNLTGLTPVVLTYYNLGEATLRGADLGADFLLTPRVTLRATTSLTKLEDVEVEAGREEATALNSPNTKWTLGASAKDVGPLSGSATLRHVSRYYFRSGINMGVIPTFNTVDLSVGYRLPRLNTLLNVGVSNLYACGGSFTYAATNPLKTKPASEERSCRFGRKHMEMINMPEIGTMVFLGAQFRR